MKYYDEKSRSLTLVTGIKKDNELETKTYQYPFFVKGILLKKAMELGEELETNEYVVPSDLLERMTNFIVELYNKQFTSSVLEEGIDVRSLIDTYISILFGALRGDSKNE